MDCRHHSEPAPNWIPARILNEAAKFDTAKHERHVNSSCNSLWQVNKSEVGVSSVQ
jgi:hypothetical protein